MADASPDAEDGSHPEDVRRDNLSALAASILGQLSISSWMPGAFLVISLVGVAAFRSLGSIDVVAAVALLRGTDNQIMFLIWAIPALVISAVVTQAFAFETIRLLEGYWPHRGVVGAFRRWKVRRQVGRRRRLEERSRTLTSRMFAESRGLWLTRGTSQPVLDAMERVEFGLSVAGIPEQVQTEALRRRWWTVCDPSDVARYQDLREAVKSYPPHEARTMPTDLGNVLRGAEDRLQRANDDLAGFVLRNRARVSARVLQQHDQYRSRLDMYCTLSLVCVALVIAYPAILIGIQPVVQPERVLVAMVFYGALAHVCYRAAIAAARGYGVTLRQIDLAAV